MEISCIGIVGAGEMGTQIASLAAGAGYQVILVEDSPQGSLTALNRIESLYATHQGAMDPVELKLQLMRIKAGIGLDVLAQCDLVIEAVDENFTQKAAVLKELDKILPEHSVVATTTSTMLISRLATQTKYPSRLVGAHFLNPVHAFEAVEVIPGVLTSEITVEICTRFVRSLGRYPLRIGECPGFLVNRLMLAYIQAALTVWETGLAEIEEIDQALINFGFQRGPFGLADFLGLDIIQQLSRSLQKSFGPRFSASPVLEKMVKAGWLGDKSARGFYEKGQTNENKIWDLMRNNNVGGFSDAHKEKVLLTELLLFPIINEAAACLQEGVAYPQQIDYAMRTATGFPSSQGGPLRYADNLGLDKVCVGLEYISRVDPLKFWPHYLIQAKVGSGMLGVKAGRGFYEYNKKENSLS